MLFVFRINDDPSLSCTRRECPISVAKRAFSSVGGAGSRRTNPRSATAISANPATIRQPASRARLPVFFASCFAGCCANVLLKGRSRPYQNRANRRIWDLLRGFSASHASNAARSSSDRLPRSSRASQSAACGLPLAPGGKGTMRDSSVIDLPFFDASLACSRIPLLGNQVSVLEPIAAPRHQVLATLDALREVLFY